ncbi:MAG: hypothetical protein JSS32_09475 [Verrucomicrobia bacterium]|nr:hypothetical protein [Verrucomicrobiota bacterium]
MIPVDGSENKFLAKLKRDFSCMDGKKLGKIGAVAFAAIATIVCFIFLPWQVGICAACLTVGLLLWTLMGPLTCKQAQKTDKQRTVFMNRFVLPWKNLIQRRFAHLDNVQQRG